MTENTATEYVKVPGAEACSTDEFMLNGTWHKAKFVAVVRGTVTVVWPEGGRMSGPAHHLDGRVRRAVQA